MDDRARVLVEFYGPTHIGPGFQVKDKLHPNGHLGQDVFRHELGTWIPAIAAGVVVAVGYDSDTYGNYVSVDIGDVNVYYCHLLNHGGRYAGQKISFGEGVAPLGTSGYSTGPHLHMGVGTGKTPQQRTGLRDPLPYIIAARTSAAGSDVTPLPNTGTTHGGDDDMPFYDLIETPDGTIWYCVDRLFRYAIPNPRNLATYQAHLAALGKDVPVVKKSAEDANAYGSPVYADPITRIANQVDRVIDDEAILEAVKLLGAASGSGIDYRPLFDKLSAEIAANPERTFQRLKSVFVNG